MWNDLTEIPTEIQDGLNDVILYAEPATEQNWTLPGQLLQQLEFDSIVNDLAVSCTDLATRI